jgi:putative ABC transport system permease protein
VLLFALILAVCALFVGNAAAAAVRTRRTELGVLACLGWGGSKLFAVVLTEVGLIGLVAGLTGAALALPLSAAFGLAASSAEAILAVVAATGLTLLAGMVPAWRASRSHPSAALRAPVLAVRAGRSPRGVAGLAVTNLLRVPGRSVLGALALAIGICALTLLLAFTLAFRGEVVGTLLGDVVAVQTRSVDYVAASVTVLVGVFAAADVVYLNTRERLVELAVLRAIGWHASTLIRLITIEGAWLGLAGSVAGAVAGLAGAAVFTGTLSVGLLIAALVAAAAGTALVTLAAVAPASVLGRRAGGRLLADQ